MTPREVNDNRLAEALREHVASQDRRIAELQSGLTQAHGQLTESRDQQTATTFVIPERPKGTA